MKNKEKPQTKICRHCKSEIPYGAKICPQCRKKQGNKKKWIIIALVVFWIIGAMVRGENDNESVDSDQNSNSGSAMNENKEGKTREEVEKDNEDGQKDEKPKEEKETEFEYGGCEVKYLRHEIMENDMGETVLVVYYDFTNNGNEPQCFAYLVTGKAFQNGIEVESSYFHANEESKNSGKEIQKGVSITVADSYVLGESRDNVTIEFRPFNVWSDKLLMSMEIALQ